MSRFDPAETLVLVPALNEQDTVADVVRSARSMLGCDVLVIDDGSWDATGSRALDAGALVVTHPFNLGVGGAIRTGFRVARDQGRRYVVQLDADGQHEPAEAKRLLDRVVEEGADMAVGSRFGAGYRVSRARHLMMRLLSRTVSRHLGTRIDDTTSGFRAFGPRAVAEFARGYPTEYLSDTVEALLIAADEGFRVVVEPVQMHPRQGGRPSAGRARSAVQLVRLWLVILMHPVRTSRPKRPGSS
jgi:glycosyltransferase involved in cell wall biosynthesis